MNTENKETEKQCDIHVVSSSMGCSYSITSKLRYVKKQIYFDQGIKYELRLQQMWQGDDGSEDWQWVEVVE